MNIFKSGSTEQKKKITFIAIYATIAIIVCLLGAVLIAQTVANKSLDPGSSGGDGSGISANFTEEEVTSAQLHSGSLVLVNKDNEYIFEDNPEVVSFPTTGRLYGLKNSSLKANPTALAAFNEMMTAAYANIDDAKIVVMTAYRSAQDQTDLKNGTPAGYSDFHTGMSFELKESETWAPINAATLNGKYNWLYEHAHEFGFVVRYPADTSDKKFSEVTGVEDYAQVFRYVGVAHATYMYEKNLCLEEYLELLRDTYTYENPLAIKGADGKSYEVYYIEADENSNVLVSSKYGYEISGDNMNGYIVTNNKATKSKDTASTTAATTTAATTTAATTK